MLRRTAADYVQSAERRLRNAGELRRQASGRSYEDAYLEMADVAMLLWSAGIDVISALMTEDGVRHLGSSSTRFVFLRELTGARYPLVRKPLDAIGWPFLARMHNFQHNLDMSEYRFLIACQRCGQLFAVLNSLLPATLRLPEDAYAWLLNVR